jgi:hypothetical protein
MFDPPFGGPCVAFRDLLLALAASPPDAAKPTKFDQFATSHPSVGVGAHHAAGAASTSTAFYRRGGL